MSTDWLISFWAAPALNANIAIFLNLVGALLLGLVLGYERAYHGRAAGMRTYGIVCMASAALSVLAGYPAFWFGGGPHGAIVAGDPTRVIQGVVTGVGFLGAGVIMKEGLNISGLTTAASIWAASAIGILVGIGFYGAAILLTALSASLMMWGAALEMRLPSRHAISVTLRFAPGQLRDEDWLRQVVCAWGYELARGSLTVCLNAGQAEWRFVAVALRRVGGHSLLEVAHVLRTHPEVDHYQLAHARN